MNSSFNESGWYTDHPEWGDEVLRIKNGTVKNPMEINWFLACLLGLFCWFGFPLNFEIIIRILYDKTMRLKPQYIIKLGIAFSAIAMLTTNVIAILHFIIGPNETICHFFVTCLMGVPYNCFLLNYFLSSIDCFIAITFPIWHLTRVTPRRVVYGLIVLNLAMILAIELPFISGSLEVRCALQPSHGLVLNGTASVSFVLCFIFCCVDFVITWFNLPRSSRAFAVPSDDPTTVQVEFEMQGLLELVF